MSAGIASGLSYGTHPINEHATTAVRRALERAGINQARSVLLFMTPEYQRDPATPLRLAARAANCLQVCGCIGYGLLTDQEWLLDSPGVAAMVFGGGAHLAPASVAGQAPVLSLCTPAGFDPAWMLDNVPHIGAITSDPLGQGDYQLWSGARLMPESQLTMSIRNTRAAFAVAQSFRLLSSPARVTAVDSLDLISIEDRPALEALRSCLAADHYPGRELPLHMLLAGITFGDPVNAIEQGRFRLDHIVSTNPEAGSITLTEEVQAGDRLFLAMRDPSTAESQMVSAVQKASRQLGEAPDFGLLFSCLGRGPSFYGGRDRDLEVLRKAYPDMPLIGIYANGEIGPLRSGNHVFQYSSVLGLFRTDETFGEQAA